MIMSFKKNKTYLVKKIIGEILFRFCWKLDEF